MAVIVDVTDEEADADGEEVIVAVIDDVAVDVAVLVLVLDADENAEKVLDEDGVAIAEDVEDAEAVAVGVAEDVGTESNTAI